jgi:amino acid adenylation domain-containing protein
MALSQKSYKSIPRRDKSEPCPLSFAQERLWFLNQLEPDSPVYNQPKAIRLSGDLNIAALKKALDVLIERHEVLRTKFLLPDGRPVQIIGPVQSITLSLTDLSTLPSEEREIELCRRLLQVTDRVFNLSQDLMLRAALFRMTENEHVLLLVTHHIASDGWSTGILLREIVALYESFSAGEASPLADLPIQYADYAVWQREWLRGEVLERHLSYWKEKLAGISPLELPTDHPRPAVQTYNGARQSFAVPMNLCESLKELSRQQGVTLFMTLLAAFKVLLYRYTGQEDVVVGSPIAGRGRVEIEGLIGFFVNTLVLRTDLSGNPPFRELLKRVRESSLYAYTHQDLPFEKLVEELQSKRDLGHHPLFQVMFAFQNFPMQSVKLPGLTASPVKFQNDTAKFDLTLAMVEKEGKLDGSFEYSTDLFDETTIKRMIGHFQTLLEGVVANPDQRLSDLPILTEAERHQLLVEWNDTKREYPKDKCIHELFEAQVERSPDAVAVVFEDKTLTYRELSRRANQLAHYLQKLGVGPEVLVGLCVERSLEMVVGLLGILKVGGAYVPLDPTYPKERLAFMLKDIQAPVLLTQQQLIKKLPGYQGQLICLDADGETINEQSEDNPFHATTPANLAYVIYTSGSKGKPKGVMISHRGLINYLTWCIKAYDVEQGRGAPVHSSLSFDLTITALFAPLLIGREVHLLSEKSEVETLSAALQTGANFSLVKTTPAHLLLLSWQLLHKETAGGARTFVIGGENLLAESIAFWQDFVPSSILVNEYGPTECVVGCCFYQIPKAGLKSGSVPIGRPVANTQIYIVDSHLQPDPIGVPGELHVGGDGLARGYLNRPDLTAEKFIPNPFSAEAGARLYKTGDLARYLPDGNIEFVGRIDNQVKVRGFRIELGEIETMLVRHAAVQQVVARARDDGTGDKRLIAYVVLEQERTATTNELREFLKEQLPDYMVPSLFVFVDSLPLTPNGKIDHRALPAPNGEGHHSETDYVAPITPLESQLVKIWEEFLPVHPIGTRDNFFHIGGHSLLAARLMQRIQEVSGKKLPLSVLFTEPTIEQLAQTIVNRHVGECPSLLTQIQPGGDKIPFFFLHGDIHGGGLYCLNLARALGTERPFYVLAPQTPNGELVGNSIEAIAECYIKLMRAAQPEGPYLLGGYCNGGFVVYEMARQLKRQGEKVEQVLLIAANARNGPRMRFLQRLVFGLGYLRGLGSEETMGLFLRLRNLYLYYTGRMRDVAQWALCKQIAWAFRQVKRVVWKMARMVASAGFSRGNLFPTDGEASQKKAAGNDPLRSYSRAMNSYVTRSYSGRVVLFWPIEEPTSNSEDPSMGWGGAVHNIEVRRVPGDHTTCIRDHVRTLADQMKVCLDKVHVDRTTGEG